MKRCMCAFALTLQACIRRQRESMDGRRKALQEEKAMDQVLEELSLEIEGEERILSELVRADIQVRAIMGVQAGASMGCALSVSGIPCIDGMGNFTVRVHFVVSVFLIARRVVVRAEVILSLLSAVHSGQEASLLSFTWVVTMLSPARTVIALLRLCVQYVLLCFANNVERES